MKENPIRSASGIPMLLGLLLVLFFAAYLAFNGVRTASPAWIVAGTLVNAAICGVLSGVYPRLGVRTVWLIPFAAVLVVIALVMPPKRSAPGPC